MSNSNDGITQREINRAVRRYVTYEWDCPHECGMGEGSLDTRTEAEAALREHLETEHG